MDQSPLNKSLQKARQFVARRKYTEALNLYATLVKEIPQIGGEYGRAAADSGDFDLANRVWKKFLERQPENPRFLTRLADDYQTMGMHGTARALLAKAAGVEPRNLDLQVKYAALLIRTSSVDESRAAVDRCLEMDPRNEQARYLSAHLDRRQGLLAEAEQQLRDLLASSPRDASIHHTCHAELAQILERAGRYDEAMLTLEDGKKVARQAFNREAERKAFYERHEKWVRNTIALPKNILGVWGESFPARSRSQIPPLAFLSGAARSGTTLLERILDAHPAVAACDEPPAFKSVLPRIDITTLSIPAQRLDILRQRYVRNLQIALEAPCQGKMLLDKNPSRTVWLPGLLRIIPELRVIIALRDPRDVIVSLYFQDHVRTNYLTFAQLAEHYCRVMDVWLAVREWEGLAWLETRYEDTVANLQQEGARVTKFLGLEWNENQSRFYERNREKAVLSTNYADVTQPVYSRSVFRWRAYEKYLAPILPTLEPYCRAFGYS